MWVIKVKYKLQLVMECVSLPLALLQIYHVYLLSLVVVLLMLQYVNLLHFTQDYIVLFHLQVFFGRYLNYTAVGQIVYQSENGESSVRACVCACVRVCVSA